MGTAKEAKSPAQLSRSGAEARDSSQNVTIDIRENALHKAEVKEALKSIPNPGPALRREITHVPFRDDGTAFLIPLGPPSGDFKALFFYPRSPGLPLADLVFQALGFGLVGAAFASAALGSRLRTKAGQLRERLSLLRSMQIAFLQVDEGDWVLEANDRAEELFRRQLPKPGMTRHKVNFSHLISARLVETEDPGVAGSPRYKELTAKEISKMRSRGQASSYYARLSGKDRMETSQPSPGWLQVSATPLMHLRHGERSSAGLHLGSISATAHEVASEIAARLEEALQEITRQKPRGGVD
jgi:hypothetical protein